MSRFAEFLEGENGVLSMARLLTFISWFPATALTLWIHTTEALSVYLGAFVLNSVANKGIDVYGRKKNAKSNPAVSD